MRTNNIRLWLIACASLSALMVAVPRISEGATTSGRDCLVVDLSAGPSASSYPVTHLDAPPVGGWSDEYKTTKLVLRRIPAGSFTMGTPTNEPGYQRELAPHPVTLTQDFYTGLFEVTQKQWEQVMGTRPAFFDDMAARDTRPVEMVTYDTIRGAHAGTNWSANGDVDKDSFMGRLRARTGKAFDLPTESQWEYAARAGTTSALNSGKNLTTSTNCPNMSELGRYLYNGGSGYSRHCAVSNGTAAVGSYLPNAWGLYDMHGNVLEWCLDWYGSYPATATDPKGPVKGSCRVIRGGAWSDRAKACTAASRNYAYPDSPHSDVGFRVAVPAGP